MRFVDDTGTVLGTADHDAIALVTGGRRVGFAYGAGRRVLRFTAAVAPGATCG